MKEYEQKICNIIDKLKTECERACREDYVTGYDHGKRDGYAEGQKSLVNAYVVGKGEETLEDIKKAEYYRGLNEAWEVARKIVLGTSKGGYSMEVLQRFFSFSNLSDIFSIYGVTEAIARIKAYEDKQKQDAEIKVGDEIRLHDAIEVVTSVMPTGLQTIDASGNTSTWYYKTYPLETWKKTGRHFPQIAEVLAEMRGDE